MQLFSTPTDIATDNAGNVYVLSSENDKVQESLLLMVHLLKNGASKEQTQSRLSSYSLYRLIMQENVYVIEESDSDRSTKVYD